MPPESFYESDTFRHSWGMVPKPTFFQLPPLFNFLILCPQMSTYLSLSYKAKVSVSLSQGTVPMKSFPMVRRQEAGERQKQKCSVLFGWQLLLLESLESVGVYHHDNLPHLALNHLPLTYSFVAEAARGLGWERENIRRPNRKAFPPLFLVCIVSGK